MDRILIIDTDRDFVRSIRVLLVENGFDVVEANRGDVGLKKVADLQPAVIILDLDSPEINGFDFLNTIRGNPTHTQQYLIALGKQPENEDRTFSIEIGADSYLSRPFQDNDLLNQIQRGIEQYKARLATDIDPLTKLYTRQFFRIQIPREIARCERYGTPLSAILISIDEYADYLRTYELPIVNNLVKKIADIISTHTRKTDLNVYWGNDEFLILSTDTGDLGAVKLAEKIRSLIEKSAFKSIGKVTASFGISGSAHDEIKLFEGAYRALKKAQSNNGNQIITSPRDTSEE